MQPERTHAAFATTCWTDLALVRDGTDEQRRAAMRAIAAAYWAPAYAAVRRSGRGREEATELTQAFFADVLLGRNLAAHADATRGRWRTLLLTALRNFLVDHHRHRPPETTLSALPATDLDREDEFLAANPQANPAEVFDRRWALALLEQALSRCESHYRATGKARNWEAFAARVLVPATGNCPPPALDELASRLGFAGAPDVAAAVQTVKRLVMATFHQLTAETVTDPAIRDTEDACLDELLRRQA